ncbi:hypothetical protein EI94DRAFT_1774481 [Lactarius quietus]|nr:hypothetical protein EI94DRAFT_1774481 [Lactarius quietus]
MGITETSSNLIVEQFPYGQLGAPVAHLAQGTTLYESTQDSFGDSVWAPFRLQCDWELAHLAKMHGPTSSAVTDLLAIPGLINGLRLSYHTSKELNSIIDKQLLGSGTPAFKTQDLKIRERHYTDPSCTCRIYNKMHTGDWWWSVQTALESCRPGATVVPLIISSNKTLLTVFCGKMAYPIYMGIGNIVKDIRQKPSRMAQRLIGYIPTSKLEGITNKAAHQHALANLFHSCMGKVLNPIQSYGETGLTIMCGDGTWHHCHPIFATFVGDYPEQTLVTCTYNGQCSKCSVPHDQLGDFNCFAPCDYAAAINNYEIADEDPCRFNPACRATGLKPVYHPFWQYLPLMDIFLAITLDILHQLLQGVVKHLMGWLSHPFLFGLTAINARCQSLPPSHHTSLFTKGLPFSRVTGKEHKNICRGHSPVHVLRAVRAILNFVYLAQFPSHTTDTLKLLEDSLSQFHDNKATGYGASNHKDALPQMTVYVERHEKIHMHMAFIQWRQDGGQVSTCNPTPLPPPELELRQPKMTKHPTCKSVSFKALAEQYGAVEFQDALADYIAGINHPSTSAATLHTRASDTLIPFRSVPVFHRIKFTPASNADNTEIVDSVVIWPEQKDACGRIVPGRFDTILIRGTQDSIYGNNGHRIAQLCVVFQLPTKVIDNIFPGWSAPIHLAYVEWFSPLSTTWDPNHQLHRVTRLMHGGRQRAMVIPVESILGSVHLFPRFGLTTTPHWSSFSVLEQCTAFYVNPFSDRQNYLRFR